MTSYTVQLCFSRLLQRPRARNASGVVQSSDPVLRSNTSSPKRCTLQPQLWDKNEVGSCCPPLPKASLSMWQLPLTMAERPPQRCFILSHAGNQVAFSVSLFSLCLLPSPVSHAGNKIFRRACEYKAAHFYPCYAKANQIEQDSSHACGRSPINPRFDLLTSYSAALEAWTMSYRPHRRSCHQSDCQ